MLKIGRNNIPAPGVNQVFSDQIERGCLTEMGAKRDTEGLKRQY